MPNPDSDSSFVAIDNLEVEISFSIGNLQINATQLKALKPDGIISVAGMTFPLASAMIGEQEFAQVELVNVEDRASLRILSRFDQDTNS